MTGQKITGENADIALNYITSTGLAKLNKDDNGGTQEKYYILKDGKTLEATADELAQHFASTHEQLVSSSGNAGTGQDHSSDNKVGAKQGSYENLQATRNAAAEMLSNSS